MTSHTASAYNTFLVRWLMVISVFLTTGYYQAANANYSTKTRSEWVANEDFFKETKIETLYEEATHSLNEVAIQNTFRFEWWASTFVPESEAISLLRTIEFRAYKLIWMRSKMSFIHSSAYPG